MLEGCDNQEMVRGSQNMKFNILHLTKSSPPPVMNEPADLEPNPPPSYEESVFQDPNIGNATVAYSARQMTFPTSTTNTVTALAQEPSMDDYILEYLDSSPQPPATICLEIERLLVNIIPLSMLVGLFYAMNWTYYRSRKDVFEGVCALWGIMGFVLIMGNWYCCRPRCTDVPTWGSCTSLLVYLLILVGGGFLVRADIFRLRVE
jgi:hypothetical protein